MDKLLDKMLQIIVYVYKVILKKMILIVISVKFNV